MGRMDARRHPEGRDFERVDIDGGIHIIHDSDKAMQLYFYLSMRCLILFHSHSNSSCSKVAIVADLQVPWLTINFVFRHFRLLVSVSDSLAGRGLRTDCGEEPFIIADLTQFRFSWIPTSSPPARTDSFRSKSSSRSYFVRDFATATQMIPPRINPDPEIVPKSGLYPTQPLALVSDPWETKD